MSTQSSWLAGADVTTPANDRHSVLEQPGTARAVKRPTVERPTGDLSDGRARTGRADALAFLAAVWVVIAAVPVAYLPTGRFDLLWNDTMVGIAAGVVTMTRLVRSGMAPSTTGITCALGVWLAAAPLVLGYGDHPTEHLARWNDHASGTAIAVLSVATLLTARARRAGDEVRRPPSGLVAGAVEPVDG
jgi:SPW repeat